MLRWMQVAFAQPNPTVPTPHQNGRHTIFGQVIEVQEIVDAISLVATQGADRPVQPVIILGIGITKTS